MSNQPDSQLIDETAENAPAVPYRSLSILAVLGMTVAFFSILSIFHWLFWIIPVTAIVLGWRAIKQIQHAPKEYVGVGFARSGMAIAMVLGIFGSIIYSYNLRHSIPTGYRVVKWDDLQPNPNKPAEIIPEAAYDLEPSDKDRDRRIYITGYINLNMTNRTINLKQFILVPTAGHCNFCQTQLKSTEMILINFTGGKSIDATQGEIKLGGKFTINRDQAANPFGGLPYQLDADYLQE